MAITLTSKTGDFDPYTRDQASFMQKLRYADGSAGTASQRATAQAELDDKPDFRAELQATTDTSNLQAVDLTDEGVTFPSRSVRKIKGKSWCLTDNDTYFYEWEEEVLGGTTPVLLGQRILRGFGEENGAARSYGQVHFQATLTALTTITEIFASKGVSLGDITAGDADLTIPKNRLCLVKGHNLSQPSAITASTLGAVLAVNPAILADGSGTAAVGFLNTIAGTGWTATSPALGGVVDLAFELWPPFNHRLVMNSNNVEVQCTAVDAIGDDNLRHIVEVFVGKAETRPYSAA